MFLEFIKKGTKSYMFISEVQSHQSICALTVLVKIENRNTFMTI